MSVSRIGARPGWLRIFSVVAAVATAVVVIPLPASAGVTPQSAGAVAFGHGPAVGHPAAAGLVAAGAAKQCADGKPFKDVPKDNTHCDNIAWLKDQGITKPADGKYDPAGTVNRGSMATFLFRLLNPDEPAPACTKKPFKDVKKNHRFCGYIEWAVDSGLAKGYDDGTYRPEADVTRGAMVTFLQRAVGTGVAPTCTDAPFRDVTAKHQLCATIAWAARNTITTGVGCGFFAPEWPVNRQSMASFLRRASAHIGKVEAPASTDLSEALSKTCARPVLGREYGVIEGHPRRPDLCPASAAACIDLTYDETWLQSNGKVTYGPVPITSGKPGFRTRTGNWTVYYKNANHWSREFNAPMPNAVFFDHIGIAFHAGSLTVLSHGCIHLSNEASRVFFNRLGYGAKVSVFGYAPY